MHKGGHMVTYEDVVQNIEVRELIKNAQKQLDVLAYSHYWSQDAGNC